MSNRITIILPKLSAGGTERTAVELANYMVNTNIEVTVILMFKCELFFKLDKRIKIIQPDWQVNNKFAKIFFGLSLIQYLNRSIKNSRPDSILLLGYILLSLIALTGVSSRVFFSNRTNPYRARFVNSPLLSKMYLIMYTFFSAKVNGIIAQTELSKNHYSKRFKCPIQVIPNSLKEMQYYPEIEKKEIVLSIGRAVPEKGQKYFIDLVLNLSQSSPDLKFILVGDGPELLELKNYANALGVYNKIDFLGFIEDVDVLLAESKYFVLTSLTEGYPNVIIEAMAHGTVPIAFDCVAGPSEIINNGENGYLVGVGNLKLMAERVNYLKNNNDVYANLSMNAKKVRIVNDKEILNKKWVDFISES